MSEEEGVMATEEVEAVAAVITIIKFIMLLSFFAYSNTLLKNPQLIYS